MPSCAPAGRSGALAGRSIAALPCASHQHPARSLSAIPGHPTFPLSQPKRPVLGTSLSGVGPRGPALRGFGPIPAIRTGSAGTFRGLYPWNVGLSGERPRTTAAKSGGRKTAFGGSRFFDPRQAN